MSRNLDTQFRQGSNISSSGRLMKRMLQRVFAQLEARMKVTNQQFGVLKQTLADGTEMWLTVNFNGPVPIRRSFVVAKPITESLLLGNGQFYIFSYPELWTSTSPEDEIIKYVYPEYEAVDESVLELDPDTGLQNWKLGYKTGSHYWSDGVNILSFWLLGFGENPSHTNFTTFGSGKDYRKSFLDYATDITQNYNQICYGDTLFLNGVVFSTIPAYADGILGAGMHAATGKVLVIVTKPIDSPNYENVYLIAGEKVGDEVIWEELSGPIQFYCIQTWQFNSTGSEAVCVGNTVEASGDSRTAIVDRTSVFLYIDESLNVTSDITTATQCWEISYNPLNNFSLEGTADPNTFYWTNYTIQNTSETLTDTNCLFEQENFAYITNVGNSQAITQSEAQQVYSLVYTIPIFYGYDKNNQLFGYKIRANVNKNLRRSDYYIETTIPNYVSRTTTITTYKRGEGCDISDIPEDCGAFTEIEISGNLSFTGLNTADVRNNSTTSYNLSVELLDKDDNSLYFLQTATGSENVIYQDGIIWGVQLTETLGPITGSSCTTGTQVVSQEESLVGELRELNQGEWGGTFLSVSIKSRQLLAISNYGSTYLSFEDNGEEEPASLLWGLRAQAANSAGNLGAPYYKAIKLNKEDSTIFVPEVQDGGDLIRIYDGPAVRLVSPDLVIDLSTTNKVIDELIRNDILALYLDSGGYGIEETRDATSDILIYYRLINLFTEDPFVRVNALVLNKDYGLVETRLNDKFTLYPDFPPYEESPSYSTLPGVGFAVPVNYENFLELINTEPA